MKKLCSLLLVFAMVFLVGCSSDNTDKKEKLSPQEKKEKAYEELGEYIKENGEKTEGDYYYISKVADNATKSKITLGIDENHIIFLFELDFYTSILFSKDSYICNVEFISREGELIGYGEIDSQTFGFNSPSINNFSLLLSDGSLAKPEMSELFSSQYTNQLMYALEQLPYMLEDSPVSMNDLGFNTSLY